MTLEVAAIQHDIVWEDRRANLERLSTRVKSAAASGARLLVLPEMFATGWSMETHRTAEAEDGPTVSWMLGLAVDLDVWIAGSIATKTADDELPTNRLVVVGPEGVVDRYDKRHLVTVFDIHAVGEQQRFRPGERSVVATICGLRFGLTICYDLRFADLYWHLAAEVDAYLVVANWPAVRRHHWTSLLRARAIENQAYVIGVNRVGEGGGIEFAGDSRIIDPMGHILASGGNSETTHTATLDSQYVTLSRTQFPFITDRLSV